MPAFWVVGGSFLVPVSSFPFPTTRAPGTLLAVYRMLLAAKLENIKWSPYSFLYAAATGHCRVEVDAAMAGEAGAVGTTSRLPWGASLPAVLPLVSS